MFRYTSDQYFIRVCLTKNNDIFLDRSTEQCTLEHWNWLFLHPNCILIHGMLEASGKPAFSDSIINTFPLTISLLSCTVTTE